LKEISGLPGAGGRSRTADTVIDNPGHLSALIAN